MIKNHNDKEAILFYILTMELQRVAVEFQRAAKCFAIFFVAHLKYAKMCNSVQFMLHLHVGFSVD